MEQTALATIETRTAALSTFGTKDLMVQESVDALVKTAVEVNEQAKALKAQDDLVKSEFKRMCKPYTDEGHGVIVYAFDQEKKMMLTLSGGGMELNDAEFLKQIYAMYGEAVGDKGGKAWRAYCAVSDPLEAPRKLNPDKIAYEVAKAKRIASGLEEGEIMITEAQVQAATVEKPISLSARCSDMTKSELKAYKLGELKDTMVLK